MGKEVEKHSKVELSIGSYYQFSAEGPEDFVEDRLTQLLDFVIANGMPVEVKDGNLDERDNQSKDEPKLTLAWCNTCGTSVPTDKSSLRNHKCRSTDL